jgi:hypothetical protein
MLLRKVVGLGREQPSHLCLQKATQTPMASIGFETEIQYISGLKHQGHVHESFCMYSFASNTSDWYDVRAQYRVNYIH